MNFSQLRRRVERAEQLVEGRQAETLSNWQALQGAWRLGWTPPRIVIAGLISGFIAGKLRPAQGRAVAHQATRWVQLFSTVSGLFTAMQAQFASTQAERAGDHAEAAADSAQAVAGTETPVARAPEASMEREAAYSVPPRPAEAATEVSER